MQQWQAKALESFARQCVSSIDGPPLFRILDVAQAAKKGRLGPWRDLQSSPGNELRMVRGSASKTGSLTGYVARRETVRKKRRHHFNLVRRLRNRCDCFVFEQGK